MIVQATPDAILQKQLPLVLGNGNRRNERPQEIRRKEKRREVYWCRRQKTTDVEEEEKTKIRGRESREDTGKPCTT
ncbi:hypothetical protein SLA2020_411140 [Shorea laevis]